MRKTVRKTFWAWEFDREEKWLNRMSAEGWQLVEVGVFRYVFEQGAPSEYDYRLELLEELPTHPKSIAYLDFMEETGVEHLGSIARWVYFRKKHDEHGFDLFSDLDSRIKHIQRVLTLVSIIAIVETFSLSTVLRGFDRVTDPSAYPVLGVMAALLGIFTLLIVYGLFKTIGIYTHYTKERKFRE